MAARKKSKSKEFLELFSKGAQVVVMTHNNPDPDGLAGQLAISRLLERRRCITPTLVSSGIVRRAENVMMIDACDIALVDAGEIPWTDDVLSVLVDTKPGTGNNAFPRDRQATAVIDHHPGRMRGRVPVFRDIRMTAGASATILSEYLEEENTDIDAKLATALIYALESETSRSNVVMGDADVRQLVRLYPLADQTRLDRIRNARLPQAYFEAFLLALRDSFTYGDVILSLLAEIEQPDIVSEIADFLVRFEEVNWAFVGGVHNKQLVISARTTTREHVGRLLRKVVGRLGTAGGHETFAGAQINLKTGTQAELDKLLTKLRARVLRHLGIQQERGARLVARRDILAKM